MPSKVCDPNDPSDPISDRVLIANILFDLNASVP